MTMKKMDHVTIEVEGSDGDEIDLKNPIFGDVHTFNNCKILNQSMFGYNNVCRPAEYADIVALHFSFKAMTNYEAFVTFIEYYIGKRMKITTHHNLEYYGTVTGIFNFSFQDDSIRLHSSPATRCNVGWSFIFEVEAE